MDTPQNPECDSIAAVAAIDDLPGLGYFSDDIQAQLTETAKSISQDIIDVFSQQYRKKRATQTLPEAMWKPLRGKAYLIAAKHCEDLAKDLREAAKDPNMAL